MKCRFYDDGCGNGGYCSSMSVNPPSCSLDGDIKCKGDTKKCNITGQRHAALTNLSNAILKEK